MSRPKNAVPSYRLHRQSGQAIATVNVNGIRRDVLLGAHGSPESQQEYERLLARLRSSGPTQALCHDNASDPTVAELVAAYARHTEALPREPGYKPGGTSPRYALRKLRELFGPLPAFQFGPKALGVVRAAWVAEGACRKTINARTGAIRRLFKWAISEELMGPETYQRLQAVEGLRAGQTTAVDRPPVRPAMMADVEKAIPFMPEMVRTLVLVQLHSAARAGELVMLRVGDIDRSNPEVWTYSPAAHKTTWKGKSRTIYFGSRCQEVLAPLILKAGSPHAYVFSPARSEAERNVMRSANRLTKLWPSHAERNERKRVGTNRKRAPREHYTTGTYRRAIERACDAAGAARFTPHRLRHLAATRVRAELGVDTARALCGHTLASVTEIYSREVDRALALQAVKRLG